MTCTYVNNIINKAIVINDPLGKIYSHTGNENCFQWKFILLR